MLDLLRVLRNTGAGDQGGGGGADDKGGAGDQNKGGAGDQGGAGAGDQGKGAAGDQGGGNAFDWHSQLTPDLKGSPFISKFENTSEGLKKAMQSYGNLEQLLGHEKVPIPKDENDTEGWARYRTAMKVPEKPEGYGLEDAKVPEVLKGVVMDKNKFAAFMHSQHATTAQTKAAWNMYVQENVNAYNTHMDNLQKDLEKNINVLKQEWGGAYDVNIELGQSVINQFAGDKETADFLTASLLKDPRGIKFMKTLGDQFAENKIGDFNLKRFAVSPDDAQNELNEMMRDLNGPYFNDSGKFSKKEQDTAVARATTLREIIAKAKQRQA